MKAYSAYIKERARKHDPRITRWEDKIHGHFIAQRMGVPVPKLLGIYDDVKDIQWDTLPGKYIIKVNNWAACHGVLAMDGDYDLVHKKKATRDEVMQYISMYLDKKFVQEVSQGHIKPRIMIEEMLEPENPDDKLPTDYKCFVFDGKVHYIQVVRERALGKVVHDFMTPDWEKVTPPMVTDYFKHGKDIPPRPRCLDRIIKYAEVLGSEYGEHIRVDMFATKYGAVFGEFTLQPASGDYFSERGDLLLGELYAVQVKAKTFRVSRHPGKSLCIVTVVDENYQHYVPAFIYSACTAYPEYMTMVLVRGELNKKVQDCIKLFPESMKFQIFENYCNDYPFQAKTTACLRYVIPKSYFAGFDYVHINDIDMLIMRDEPTMLDFHASRMDHFGWVYSNTSGSEESPYTGHARRLPALPVFHIDWYDQVEKVAVKYRKLLKDGEIGLMEPYDEIMQYKITQQAGLPLPKIPYEANYHGLHLGLWDKKLRAKYKGETFWNNLLATRIRYYYLIQYEKLLHDKKFIECKNIAMEDEKAKYYFGQLDEYTTKITDTDAVVNSETTLALNMIVGPNESYELERCLKSIVLTGIFDEIIIGVTTKDDKVWKIAEKYATKVVNIEWKDDFAYARNAVLDETSSEFVLWLDADDIIDKLSQDGLKNIKKTLVEHREKKDVFFMQYNLAFHGDTPTISFMKERIFKNDGLIRWKHAIHEQLTYNFTAKRHVILSGIYVNHKPAKPAEVGVARNLFILKNLREKYPHNEHVKYYYMRDLIEAGEHEEGEKILRDMLERNQGNRIQIANVCIQMALSKIYGKVNGNGDDHAYEIKEMYREDGKWFARKAIELCPDYAEPYVIMGDMAENEGQREVAINLFLQAMSKKIGSFGLQQVSFYKEVPAKRLMLLYCESEDYDKALIYSRLALECDPDNKGLQQMRQEIIREIK